MQTALQLWWKGRHLELTAVTPTWWLFDGVKTPRVSLHQGFKKMLRPRKMWLGRISQKEPLRGFYMKLWKSKLQWRPQDTCNAKTVRRPLMKVWCTEESQSERETIYSKIRSTRRLVISKSLMNRCHFKSHVLDKGVWCLHCLVSVLLWLHPSSLLLCSFSFGREMNFLYFGMGIFILYIGNT